MSSKRIPVIAGVGLVILLALLFALPNLNNPDKKTILAWNSQGVECLDAHANATLHFHPALRIFVDGVEEIISANVGSVNRCMSEVHTHDATGTIHIESINDFKPFHLKDFFVVYEQPIEREGYMLKMMVDGKDSLEFGSLLLRDKQKIVLEYVKK